MSGYRFHQSLRNDRGVTLIELFLSLAMVMIFTFVLAGIFQVQMKSFNYSARQTTVLANARQAMDAGASKPGMIRDARAALTLTALTTAQLTLNMPGGSTAQYALSGQNVLLTQSGQSSTLAKNISVLQLTYYNMTASGLIMVSTQTSAASMVTGSIQSQLAGGKTYTFYSGGRLRNHS